MLLPLSPLPLHGPGGVLQLDGHAGVEEETEQEVQDWVAGHREMSPDLRPHQSHLANEDEIEDPTKDVSPIHCELQQLEEYCQEQEDSQAEVRHILIIMKSVLGS